MPVETSRTVSSLKIKDPDDPETYVVLKVIDQIGFVKDRGFQEYVYGFQNWRNEGTRDSRTVEVGESKLKVSRIDTLQTIDENKLYQESVFTFNNSDPPTHLKTHDVKIYATDAQGNKNEDVWIKVRRVDQIGVMDPKEGYQETVFSLNWSSNPDWDYTNLGRLYEQTPPYRLDPFQTIIDASFAGDYLLVLHSGNSISACPMKNIRTPVATIQKTLEYSSWSGQSQYQFKISNTWNTLVARFKFEDGVITDADDWLVYAVNKGLGFPPAVSQLAGPWNGSGNTIFNVFGEQFTLTQNRVLSVAGPDGDYGSAVTSSGQRLPGAYVAARAVFAGNTSAAIAYGGGVGGYSEKWLVFGGSGEPENNVSYTDFEDAGPSEGSASGTGYVQTISQVGGIDVFGAQHGTVSASASCLGNPFNYGSESTYSVEGLGFTISANGKTTIPGYDYDGNFIGEVGYFTGQAGYAAAVNSLSWPNSGSFIVSKIYSVEEPEPDVIDLTTPYGDFSGIEDFDVLIDISNGKHLIQGFKTQPDGTVHLYLDGQDWLSAVESFAGVSYDQIDCIILDVKGSDIAKLK